MKAIKIILLKLSLILPLLYALSGCKIIWAILDTPIAPPAFLNDGFSTSTFQRTQYMNINDFKGKRAYGFVFIKIPEGYELSCGNSLEELMKDKNCNNSSSMITYGRRNPPGLSPWIVYVTQAMRAEDNYASVPIPLFKKLIPNSLVIAISVVSTTDPTDQRTIRSASSRFPDRLLELWPEDWDKLPYAPKPRSYGEEGVVNSCSCPSESYHPDRIPALICKLEYLCIKAE